MVQSWSFMVHFVLTESSASVLGSCSVQRERVFNGPRRTVPYGLYCLQSRTTYPGSQLVLAVHLLPRLVLKAAAVACSDLPLGWVLVNFSRSLVESIRVSTANSRSGTVWREASSSLRKDAAVG